MTFYSKMPGFSNSDVDYGLWLCALLHYGTEPTFRGFLVLLSKPLASTSNRERPGQRPSIKAPDT